MKPAIAEEEVTVNRRVWANAAYLFAANIWRVLVNMAVFFVIARVIGSAELGRYAFALSFATLFAIAADLGFNDLIIRDVASHRLHAGPYLGTAFVVRAALGTIAAGATVLAAGLSGKPAAVQELVCAAALTTALVSGVETAAVALFYAYERMSYVLALGLFKSTANASVGITAALAGFGARGILWGFLLVESVSALTAFYLVRFRLGVRMNFPNFRGIGQLIVKSLPFGLNGIFITIYMQLHYSLLSFFKGDVITGNYAAAAKLVTFLAFVPSALTQAVYPYLSRLAASPDRSARGPAATTLRFLTLIAFPTATFLYLRAGVVVASIYGAKYTAADILLKTIALAIPFVFANYPLAVALNAVRRERANTVVAAAGAAVNVATNFVFIPLWGGAGAAAAYVLTEGVQAVARGILARRWVGPLGFGRTVTPIIISTAVLAVASFATRRLPFYVEVPGLTVIYFASAFLTGALTKKDLAVFSRAN